MSIAAACGLNCGCVSAILSRKLVQAPNQQTLPDALAKADISKSIASDTPDFWEKIFNAPPMTASWRVTVGPPSAEIAVTAIEPASHEVKVATTIERTRSTPISGRRVSINGNMQFEMKQDVQPAKGTIILLHGICLSKESMLPWALYLSAAGYRTILVDLRGHGKSTGDYITFGQLESADLKAVLDHLERQGLVRGKVGVLGISYGAVMGIQWAARDARVGALVALEPFSDPKQAIAGFVRDVVGGPLSLLSPLRLNRAIDDAAKQAGFSWKDVNVFDALERVRFPILFFHGAHDNLLPVWHSAELKSYARPGSRLVITPDDDHMTLAMRLEPMAKPALAWFDDHLNPATTVESPVARAE